MNTSVREKLQGNITISGLDDQGDFASKMKVNEIAQLGKIYLKDFDIEENDHFVKYVFIPYFKDIYKDLAERSDNKA